MDLKLDGRSVTEPQYEVLEDVFEIGHYKFSSLSMKKCYLQVRHVDEYPRGRQTGTE